MHGTDVTAMDDRDWLPERFEEHRLPMRAVAYRMPNSLSEAEEAVPEAWLRLHRADPDAIETLSDWLTNRRRARVAEHAGLRSTWG
jgi:RNA polymerase sigma-70 factor (ECF subfamily)